MKHGRGINHSLTLWDRTSSGVFMCLGLFTLGNTWASASVKSEEQIQQAWRTALLSHEGRHLGKV